MPGFDIFSPALENSSTLAMAMADAASGFSGRAFDDNRAAIARGYVRVFEVRHTTHTLNPHHWDPSRGAPPHPPWDPTPRG